VCGVQVAAGAGPGTSLHPAVRKMADDIWRRFLDPGAEFEVSAAGDSILSEALAR
jgi:hypothetical protein